jgi:hypothetical protein
MPSILMPFQKFAYEGAAVGRLLAGYTTLEAGLFNCVQVALGDFDGVFKAMFTQRRATPRIGVAQSLGLPPYVRLGLDTNFIAAIAAMTHCLKIRNQYAHCTWWDDNTGQLVFANLEELSKVQTQLTDLRQLGVHHVDATLLDEQETYFVYVDHYLA